MDGLDTLSKVTGVGKENIKRIWGKVKENNDILDNCKGPHKFTIELSDRKWKCELCGGTISTVSKSWYEKGLAHARNEGE